MICMICNVAFDADTSCPCGGRATREELAQTADQMRRDEVLRLAHIHAGKRDAVVHSRRINFDALPERAL